MDFIIIYFYLQHQHNYRNLWLHCKAVYGSIDRKEEVTVTAHYDYTKEYLIIIVGGKSDELTIRWRWSRARPKHKPHRRRKFQGTYGTRPRANPSIEDPEYLRLTFHKSVPQIMT